VCHCPLKGTFCNEIAIFGKKSENQPASIRAITLQFVNGKQLVHTVLTVICHTHAQNTSECACVNFCHLNIISCLRHISKSSNMQFVKIFNQITISKILLLLTTLMVFLFFTFINWYKVSIINSVVTKCFGFQERRQQPIGVPKYTVMRYGRGVQPVHCMNAGMLGNITVNPWIKAPGRSDPRLLIKAGLY